MYNFYKPETIPLLLPTAIKTCLAPWLPSSQIDRGMIVLNKGRLSHFFMHRNAVGALLDEKYPVSFIFEETDKIQQGFTLKMRHCPVCGVRGTEELCPHLAALCVLGMHYNETGPPVPMVMDFSNSKWGRLASLSYDWLSKEKGSPKREFYADGVCFSKETGEGRFEARFSKATCFRWEIFERERLPPEETALFDLYQELRTKTMTESECRLAQAGSSSLAYSRDCSLWLRLCAVFYGLAGENFLTPFFNKDTGLFHLELACNKGEDFLSLQLPKKQTADFLALYNEENADFQSLPPARKGFRVQFNKNGQLQVDPQITLVDGRRFLFSELNDKQFGLSYYFHGEGFVPVQAREPAANLSDPGNVTNTAPLFAVLEKDKGFIVEDSNIEKFLTNNREALLHADNMVEPGVFDHKSLYFPEILNVDDYHEDRDWCYLSCSYQVEGSTISLVDLLETRKTSSSLRKGATSLLLKNGPLDWFYDLAEVRGWQSDSGQKGIRLTKGEFMTLVTSVERIENALKKDRAEYDRLQTFLHSETWSDISRTRDYPNYLRDYQKNGVAWLCTLCELGLGGVLADDMGLGKTHQGLALIHCFCQLEKRGPILVICPASVLPHWQDKIDHFYPEMNYSIYYGVGRDLHEAVQEGLVLTTYTIVRRDIQQLVEIPFDLVLLDEMQLVKNRKTGVHQAVQDIQSPRKIGLSGTPIENSLSDLYALFHICLPGLLGGATYFAKTFLRPITENNDSKQKNKLAALIRPFMLRRSRSQVLGELPDIIEDNRFCLLSDDQVALYKKVIDEYQSVLDRLRKDKERIDYLNILTLITRLKQICDHPCLITGETDPDLYRSGKWDLFKELLEECLGNNLKVVVFSQYTAMLDLVEQYLGKEEIPYAGLRGNMAVSRRKKMVERFSSDSNCRVFCASLLAGGTGIDLIAGQVVIHYDRWWNPAKEDQATARVHRMGQKEVVQLFRMITSGTLEEKIHGIISDKQKIAASMISEDEAGVIKQLDRAQLLELFGRP